MVHDIHNQPILALSWKQPYASLMLEGKIETRSWPTKYRGLVMLCASKARFTQSILAMTAGFTQLTRITERIPVDQNPFAGHAFAIGRLVDCRPMLKADEDKTFVRYKNGLWCHVYEDVVRIEPFAWHGVQKWKTVDEDTIKKIKFI